MSLSISYSNGKRCSLPEGGCAVVLKSNSQETLSIAKTLENTNRYFLISGTANVIYGNNAPQIISSPYSGSEWQSYIDSWVYDVETYIIVDPSTVFLQIVANNTTIGPVNVTTIDNSGIDVNVKPNSSIIVVGTPFSVDGVGYSDRPSTVLRYSEEKTVNIQTRDICKVICVEEA